MCVSSRKDEGNVLYSNEVNPKCINACVAFLKGNKLNAYMHVRREEG